jgi:CheY-like chemotaxis protein
VPATSTSAHHPDDGCLADNACRYTDSGGRIALGSRVEHEWLRFWITDSGPGVSDEDRLRIFQRFARGGAADRRSDGAGLGLAIVHAIAVAHGGDVLLDGAPGRGSTFSVVLPRPLLEGTMTHILMAEDEQRIASFIEKGLSANGFAVTTVADGPSAYDYAATGEFDLMVLDIGLSELDGFEVLRRLRSEGHWLEGGADDYMAKPFRFEELLARVRLRLTPTHTGSSTLVGQSA